MSSPSCEPRARGSIGATERFEVTLQGLRQLRQRIGRRQPEPDDWPVLDALVSTQIERAEARQQRMLAKIAARDGRPPPDAAGRIDASEGSIGPSSGSGANATSGTEPETVAGDGEGGRGDSKPAKGHGRNGAGAYSKAQHIVYALALGVIGAVCAVCGFGKMYRYRQKVVIRIVGQPLFAAQAHHYEQARCRHCGHIVRAEGPACVHEGIGSDYIQHDWSACAMLMVLHYFGGAPFKRLESLHQGWGVPMPDANQWQIVDACDDLLLPLFRALEQHAIQQATNFRIDDTGSRVISLARQIDAEITTRQRLGVSSKDVRTGINTTGSYWETPDGPILLFYTGLHHAGEIVDQLLRHRLLSSPKLVKCTDGASKNFDHQQGDTLVESTCNAHAFLKFRDIKDKHPVEYAEVGRIYQQVFDNDDKAKTLGLSPVDRMLYHRQHSQPLMQQLKTMCEARIQSKLVEPHSPLWEPLTFVINQYKRLVLFCEVPDVPLDTNLVEQALIMPVRYLAGFQARRLH